MSTTVFSWNANGIFVQSKGSVGGDGNKELVVCSAKEVAFVKKFCSSGANVCCIQETHSELSGLYTYDASTVEKGEGGEERVKVKALSFYFTPAKVKEFQVEGSGGSESRPRSTSASVRTRPAPPRSGRCKPGRLSGGVCIVLDSSFAAGVVEGSFQGWNNRIVSVDICLSDDPKPPPGSFLKIVSGYTPCHLGIQAGEVDQRFAEGLRESFFRNLSSLCKCLPSQVLLLGMDANSVLGSGTDARERALVAEEVFHIGPFGEGSRNTPGIEYESFLSDSRLTSIASHFKKRGYATFSKQIANTYKADGERIELDYIVTQAKHIRLFTNGGRIKKLTTKNLGMSDHDSVGAILRVGRKFRFRPKEPRALGARRDYVDVDESKIFYDKCCKKAGIGPITVEGLTKVIQDAKKELLLEKGVDKGSTFPTWFQACSFIVGDGFETRDNAARQLRELKKPFWQGNTESPVLGSRSYAAWKAKQQSRVVKQKEVVKYWAKECKRRVLKAKAHFINELLAIGIASTKGSKNIFQIVKSLEKSGLGGVVSAKTKGIESIKCNFTGETSSDHDGISSCCKVHFTAVYNAPAHPMLNRDTINSLHTCKTDSKLGLLPTDEEIRGAIFKASNDSSPGETGIVSEDFKILWGFFEVKDEEDVDDEVEVHDEKGNKVASRSAGQKIILSAVKSFWDVGIVSKDWTSSKLSVIYKGKGSKEDLNNYRGIMLGDVLGKIVSSIVATRLQRLLKEGEAKMLNQFGFLKDIGCAEAIFTLKEGIAKRRAAGDDSWVLFVDLVKAFDTVDRSALFLVLSKLGVPTKLIKLIVKLYSNNVVQIPVGKEKVEVPSTVGVKQGDTLAPVLFILFIRAVDEILSKRLAVSSPGGKFKYRKAKEGTNLRSDEGEELNSTTLFNHFSGFEAGRDNATSLLKNVDRFEEVLFCMNLIFYADDAGFIFGSREQLIEGSKIIYEVFQEFGLKMHIGVDGGTSKSEAMYFPGVKRALLWREQKVNKIGSRLKVNEGVHEGMTGVILKSTNTSITFLPDNVSDTYEKPNTYDKAKWITLDLTTTDTTGIGGKKGVNLRELMEIDARTADRENYKVGTYGTVSFVTKFKYLGVVIYQDLTDDDTVEKQIGKARAIFDRYRFILSWKSLNVQNRRKLYEGLVLSIALYGCECWNATASVINKLEVFHNDCCAKMVGKNSRRLKFSHTNGDAIKKKLVLTKIVDYFRLRALGFFGKLISQGVTSLAGKMLQCEAIPDDLGVLLVDSTVKLPLSIKEESIGTRYKWSEDGNWSEEGTVLSFKRKFGVITKGGGGRGSSGTQNLSSYATTIRKHLAHSWSLDSDVSSSVAWNRLNVCHSSYIGWVSFITIGPARGFAVEKDVNLDRGGSSPAWRNFITEKYSWRSIIPEVIHDKSIFVGEKPDIIIYTDGAASDNGKKNATAGIGVNFADFRTNVGEQLGEFKGEWWKNVGRPINPQLSKKPTNNAAELEAIYTALSMSIGSLFFKKKILIKTDSQYSMDQLRRGEYFKVHGWKNSNGSTITNSGLIQRTYFLLHSFPGQIAFEHVDAHMVDPGFGAPSYDDWYGNDVADKLAVEGRLLVAATKTHCADPFNPLLHNLPRNPYTNNNNNKNTDPGYQSTKDCRHDPLRRT